VGWELGGCSPLSHPWQGGWGARPSLENARNAESSQGGETAPTERRNLFDSPEGQNTPKSPPQNKARLPGAGPLGRARQVRAQPGPQPSSLPGRGSSDIASASPRDRTARIVGVWGEGAAEEGLQVGLGWGASPPSLAEGGWGGRGGLGFPRLPMHGVWRGEGDLNPCLKSPAWGNKARFRTVLDRSVGLKRCLSAAGTA